MSSRHGWRALSGGVLLSFILSISGSTVLSESERLGDLFRWHTQAIEIGSLKSPHDLECVLQNCRRFGLKLGIHSPLYAVDDRCGLLWDNGPAWDELNRNLEMARDQGVSYIVVHFPWVWDKDGSHLGIERIRETIPRLKRLERTHGVPVVCEPKLGPRRDPSALVLLWAVNRQELLQWDLSFCLDVGDIYMASRALRASYEDMVAHLAPWCHVVHLHNVWMSGPHYYWTPVEQGGNVPILRTLEILGGTCSDIVAVIEHTPHRVRDNEQVGDGLNWLLQNAGPWKGREGIPKTWDGKYTRVR